MYYKGEKMEARTSNTDFHGFGRTIRRELRLRIPAGRKIRVLDVGTGFGTNLAFLLKHLHSRSELWTLDPSEEALTNAQASLGRRAGRVVFVRGTADSNDLPGGFFDVVVSVMVMHHLADSGTVIRQLARLIKDGGRLVVVDYRPEASHQLDFHARHAEGDFFTPKFIAGTAAKLGLKTRTRVEPLWYLVDARKPQKSLLRARE